MSVRREILPRGRSWPWRAAWGGLSFGLALSAVAQDYMVKTWGVDEGLPETSVTDVTQTPDGYLWVSTLNSGLARFDGLRFVDFDLPAPALHFSGGIARLWADDTGTIWINGFGEYVASLRAGDFRIEFTGPVGVGALLLRNQGRVVFGARDGMLERTPGDGPNGVFKVIPVPGGGVSPNLLPDAQGTFWYRRTDGKPARVVGDRSETVSLPSRGGVASVVAGDKRGTIAAANPEGLFLWRGERFEDSTPTNGGWAAVRGLVSDGAGGWWLEAGGRLRRCRDREWVAEAIAWRQQERSWRNVRFAQADADGGLWFTYADAGVVHVSAAGVLSTITIAEGLPNNRVRTLMQDREGNVWASFERGGLARIRPGLFQTVDRRAGLADIVTSSVCEDPQGAIWIGTADGLVSRWYDGTCSNFALPLAPGEISQVATVCPDSAGRLWVGTRGQGLWLYETNTFRRAPCATQVGPNIRGIFVSRDDRLWAASLTGLFCWDHGDLRQVIAPQFSQDYPTAVTEGAGGTIWVAMQSARLIELADGKLLAFQPTEARMQSRFTAVHQDQEGTVWIGTLGAGLLRFRDGKFTAITRQDGLPTDIIFQVLEDELGGLWLGSPVGVINVQQAMGGGSKFTCRVFGRDDGLPSVGCASSSQPTAWRGHDGRLWFATARGVASVAPAGAKSRPIPPLVALEDLRVDGKLQASFAGQGATSRTALRLAPGTHSLEFGFTGLSFASPERIRFKYKLEGLDESWSENPVNRAAIYSSVPPGEYRFRVLACNSDGLWSANEAALDLILIPHLWEARWFRLSALGVSFLGVAGSVFWGVSFRHRRQVRALEQKHAVERERARIAKDLHDDLGTTLTQIDLLGALASRPGMSPDETLEQVGLIQSKSREMVAALDEIVWAVDPRNDSLSTLATYLCNFAEDFLSQSGIQCRFDLDEEVPDSMLTSEVRHGVFLAFKEALNNVVRHAAAKEVWLRLKVSGGEAILVVQDDGRGFVPNRSKASDGNGLRNMRERLEQIGGRCEVDGETGAGTTVRFALRLS